MDIYQPKNRLPESLPLLDIEIISRNQTIIIDPNMAAYFASSRKYPFEIPVDGLVSEISGKPAFKVNFDNISLSLSFDEIDRLFRRDLKKDEYFFLLEKYGMFHEIHEDFYDTDNGMAVQPMNVSKKNKFK